MAEGVCDGKLRTWSKHDGESVKVITRLAKGVIPWVAPDGRRDFRIPLDNSRPPQAGQLPASKALSRHKLLCSFCACGLGIIRKADCNHHTTQQNNIRKETISKSGKLKLPDNDDRPLRKPTGHQRLKKIAVINDELKRLNMYVAALQDTRLAEAGSLKVMDYVFYWLVEGSHKTREDGVGFAVKSSLMNTVEPGSNGSD
ncbi:hypothetical protein chiPu_0019125 [Chiloscyllium punctatum]|uniref:Uncharacterized protein n=1 Tax=Chiloscyllium punctatum TaxID=137246 RepID=A0A401RQW9_CHIPU|nr:hypothetical protein [Chiloscyllium punctatum]